MIQFGNNVGGKSKVKTRRSWHPNVLNRKLFSQALDRHVQVRVTLRTLRTIDKVGGLDEYLLGEKEARIKELGESGWWLRWAIMQTPAVRRRFEAEREALGVPAGHVAEEVALPKTTIQTPTAFRRAHASRTNSVEPDEGLPAPRFRVDRGKHVVLSPVHGWIRTRPTPNRLITAAKLARAKLYEEKSLATREAEFAKHMADRLRGLTASEMLSEEEQKKLLQSARREWRKEWRDVAEEVVERRVEKRNEGKRARTEAKREKRAEGRKARTEEEENSGGREVE
jgi:ribosomal protein L28